MGGGSEKTVTQSNNEPWDAAQPYLKTNMKLASKVTPEMFQPFQGSTVVPNSDQTQAGLNAMQGLAEANMGGQGLSGQYQSAIDAGGVANPFQANAAGTMGNIASGGMDVNVNPFRRIGRMAMGPSYSESNLSEMAAGNQIGSSNPYFEDALRVATERTQDAVNMGAASAGRYGSGAHTGTLAREIGDMQTTARAGQVNADLSRMMQANQMMDGQRMAGLGMGLNAQNTATGAQFQNIGNQMNASGNLFNMGQQAFQNIGNAYQGAMQPANTLGQVGASYEDLLGRQLNDQIRLDEGNKQAPLDAIMFRNAIFGGGGALGGSSSTTSQMPGQNPFATALGIGSLLTGGIGSF